ncbi:MAG TPA: sugar ABC transporter permease [Caldilineaceae bacterium]|nr:sugar ABC transporter permease [Caldilineaceae bacterium]
MVAQRLNRPRTRFRLSSQRAQDIITAYLCLAPWLIGFLSFVLGPMLFSLGLSFYESDLMTMTYFVGAKNYQELLADPLFWQSLKVTAIYAFTSVPLGAGAALLIALLLNQRLVGLGIWRTIYYLPTVISGVAVSLLWLQIFNPRAGLLNNFLGLFGIQGPTWLYDSKWALSALIIMSLWSVGSNMLLYLAGLQGIPTHLYEAATIDGANALRRFWHVTVPMLTPTIFFNVTISLIYAFQFFTQAYLMTEGGPNNATLSMVLYLYRKAFEQIRFGYASATAWVLFAIIISFTLLFQYTAKHWVYYEGESSR